MFNEVISRGFYSSCKLYGFPLGEERFFVYHRVIYKPLLDRNFLPYLFSYY